MKNTDKTHCPQGHAYTQENTYSHIKKNGVVSRYCKLCRAATDKQASKVKRLANRQRYYQILKTLSCIDCGESRPATLQFDHRDPSTKEFAISKYLGKKVPWERILKEMTKCNVRCANCHAIRTAEQQEWYKDLI